MRLEQFVACLNRACAAEEPEKPTIPLPVHGLELFSTEWALNCNLSNQEPTYADLPRLYRPAKGNAVFTDHDEVEFRCTPSIRAT